MSSIAYGALWFFIFSLPWEGVIVLPGIAIVTRIAGMVALGLAMLAVVISGRLRRWHAFHVAALLFVLWAGFILLLKRMQAVPQKYWTFVQLFLVLLIIWELSPTRRRQLGLFLAYVLGAYIAAFDTFLAYRTSGGLLRRFAAGTTDPNDLATLLALALPMAWYLGATYRQPFIRWVCRAYVPIGVVAIGLTGSRGGMLVSMVALLIVPLMMTRLSPARLATAIVFLGISGALAVSYVPDKIVKRLATTSTEVEDLRFGGRFKLWVAGLHAFTQRPVMGFGTAGYIVAITPELGRASQVAHNSFLSVLVEEGSVGLLFYLTMFVAVYLSVRRLPTTVERRFALVLFATLVIGMMPLTWEDRKTVWVVLAGLLGFSQTQLLKPMPTSPVLTTKPLVTPLARARPTARPPARPIGTPRRDA